MLIIEIRMNMKVNFTEIKGRYELFALSVCIYSKRRFFPSPPLHKDIIIMTDHCFHFSISRVCGNGNADVEKS